MNFFYFLLTEMLNIFSKNSSIIIRSCQNSPCNNLHHAHIINAKLRRHFMKSPKFGDLKKDGFWLGKRRYNKWSWTSWGQIYWSLINILQEWKKKLTELHNLFYKPRFFTTQPQCCLHCVKSVQIRSYFWSVFSCIRIKCGDFLLKSPYSVQIQENTDQK